MMMMMMLLLLLFERRGCSFLDYLVIAFQL